MSDSRRRATRRDRSLTFRLYVHLTARTEYVNMTVEELEEWLETEDSKGAGWTASGEGEAVGHQSGKKIIEILKQYPKEGKPEDYEEEDLKHMRKVSSPSTRPRLR